MYQITELIQLDHYKSGFLLQELLYKVLDKHCIFIALIYKELFSIQIRDKYKLNHVV